MGKKQTDYTKEPVKKELRTTIKSAESANFFEVVKESLSNFGNTLLSKRKRDSEKMQEIEKRIETEEEVNLLKQEQNEANENQDYRPTKQKKLSQTKIIDNPVTLKQDQPSGQKQESNSKERSSSPTHNSEESEMTIEIIREKLEENEREIEKNERKIEKYEAIKQTQQREKEKLEQQLQQLQFTTPDMNDQKNTAIIANEVTDENFEQYNSDEITENDSKLETDDEEDEEMSLNFYGLTVNDDNVKTCLQNALNQYPAAPILNLRYKKITSKGLDIILDFLNNNKQISELELNLNPIGPEGIIKLSDFLKNNKTIKTILLNEVGIDNNSLVYLMKALSHNKYLENISVDSNEIGDLGTETIMRGLSNTSIKYISLAVNKITFNDAEYLDHLILAPSPLRTICLPFNEIGESGVKHLAKFLQNNHQVTELDLLHNNSISEETCNYFSKPETTVRVAHENNEEDIISEDESDPLEENIIK